MFGSPQRLCVKDKSQRILMLGVLGLISLGSIAAAVSSRTQAGKKSTTPPVLIFVLEEQIRPGGQRDYLEGTRKWVELIQELDPTLTFTAFGDEETFVEFNERIADFDAIGPAVESWRRFLEAAAETDWGRKRAAAVEWSRMSVWEQSAELSYVPAHPEPSPKDLNAFVWRIARLRPSDEEDLIRAGLAVMALFEKAGLERGYAVFRNVIGGEGPAYSVILSGRDQAEIETWIASTTSRLAPDLSSLLRRLESGMEEHSDFKARTLTDLSLTGR
jgi:hypothetical protein